MPTDTWATRKRAEAEALEWADESAGGTKPRAMKAPIAHPTDTLERDRTIGHVEQQTQNNPYRYLGHFAGDDVVEEGHNTGKKPLGTPAGMATDMAKCGYKKLPGGVGVQVGSSSYHGRHYGDEVDRMADHARQFGLKPPKAVTSRREKQAREMAAQMPQTVRAMRGVGPIVQAAPRAVSDVKLSIKHHKESIANDTKHMKEHAASIKKHKAEMKTRMKQLTGRRKSD